MDKIQEPLSVLIRASTTVRQAIHFSTPTPCIIQNNDEVEIIYNHAVQLMTSIEYHLYEGDYTTQKELQRVAFRIIKETN